MRLLHRAGWDDGFLDEWRDPAEYRVAVRAWRVLDRVADVQIARRRTAVQHLRLTVDYLRQFGPRATSEVIASRGREALRADKYVACGLGRVVEGPGDGLSPGRAVAFLAPRHPACAERVVLPPALVSPIDEDLLAGLPADTLVYFPPGGAPPAMARCVEPHRGWSGYSGQPARPIPEEVVRYACLAVADRARADAIRLGLSGPAPICGTRPAGGTTGERRPSAMLLGYGQQARTVILPSVRAHLAVRRIHEIDPAPIPADGAATWSTSPFLPSRLEGRGLTAAFVAGFHHTHAPLAAEAVRRGMYAVVEKPLATDDADLGELLRALGRHPGRVFTCYHKRYHPFTAWARADLRHTGGPVSYHCIVFELPLPEMHWYRWPVSRSAVVSNGCHWLDHFLHLNGYAEPVAYRAESMADDTVWCGATLANGAAFTMTLSHRGSGRAGVRNYVELRASGTTVRMTDDRHYCAEDNRGIIRRGSLSRLGAYSRMYREIARRVAGSAPGDSERSLEVSASLVLALDRSLSRRAVARSLTGHPAATPRAPHYL